MAEYDNSGKSADEAYTVQQKAGQNFSINPDQLRAKALSRGGNLDGAAADSLAQEQADNEDARQAYRAITERGGLSMADLMEGLSPNDFKDNDMPVSRQDLMKLARLMNNGIDDGTQRVARELIHNSYTEDFPDEASMMSESYSGKPLQGEGAWVTEQRAAKLRSGKVVPVWMVVNENTGMKIEKPFRVQAPAERIATVLNITGNVNDPRIRQIQEDYEEHVYLMKNIRKCRSLINEGQTEYKRKLGALQMKLEGINTKLGI